ncbi:proprotein convertase subtilisin/kexin type 6-like [Mytilus californianus]|uniref:proprotein convertase subtilisin/kexin type 6-like n=1 Tax=Mytilus californianus TaxID=6549 RepID=UPI0022468163|nr:proprotein convertase subtilisin/kexin type 6-like [Mytilus californianus]
MNFYFSLLNLYLFHSVFGFRRSDFRDGEFTDRIVFTTSREDDPNIWFNKEHPGFEYIEQFRIGQEVYIKAQIRQTRTKEKLSTLREDTNVNLLRQSPGIKWVQQEIGYVRVPRTVDSEWNNLWYLNDDVTPTMKVSSAWSAGYSGSGIVIAVLDDGLQTDHPDLAANVDTTNDKDIYSSDDDPKPPSGKSHGTQVSGLIAAVKDNNICVVGVAFSSTLIGVRILGSHAISDSDEAQGLSHYLSNVDIYSNSWGPGDGTGFNGPGSLTKAALLDGVTNGRNGKGAIYIWSAGNGGTADNCNADGYVNSIYTVAISSATIGQNAWYSEVCAPALAVTYGGSENDRYLTTTTIESGCKSDGIQGTSYAAPLASGIIALTLEANSDLTWRDIQHLIVFTSNRTSLNDTYYSDWSINGANKEFSQILGFGLMDADAMVSNGKIWVTVPTQQTCTTSTISISFGFTVPIIYFITVTSGDCPSIKYLEHVVAHITFSYSSLRGVTQLYLVSPSGTRSHLLHYRHQDAIDNGAAGSLTWDFMSVHFWKENLIGTWSLEISPNLTTVTVALDTLSLTFYGTTTDPWPAQESDVVTTEPTTDAVTTPKITTDTITTEATTTAEIPTTKTTTDAIAITKTTSNTKITSPNIVEPQDTPFTSPVTPVTPETNTMNTTNSTSNVGSRSASDNTAIIAGTVTSAAVVVSAVTFFVLRKVCCGTAAGNPAVHPSI